MAYIGNTLRTAQPNYQIIDDISASFDGSTTTFALQVGGATPAPFPVSAQHCLISVGGVIQQPDPTGTDGFLLSGSNIVFSAAPSFGEDFFGVVLAGADYINVGAAFPDGSVATPSITFDQDTDTGLYRKGANNIAIATNGTERVSIGTSEVVFNDGGNDIDFRVEGDTEANLLFVDAGNDTVSFRDDVTIDSSGRLLVGTTSPLGDLTKNGFYSLIQIRGNTAGSALEGRLSLGTNKASNTVVSGSDLGAIWFQDGDGGDYAVIQGKADGTAGSGDYPGRLVFFTTPDSTSSPTERMRIDNAGNCLFHKTTTGNIQVDGFEVRKISGGSQLLLTASGNGTPAMYINNRYGAGTQQAIQFYFGATHVGSIQTTSSSTLFTNLSDYRVKENIVDITDGITRVKQLAPKRFNFIVDPDTTVDGFFAHEAQAVVPEAVSGTYNEVDDDGNPIYQGIDQSKLVPLLTAALQETIAKIETLEAEKTAQQTQLDDLIARVTALETN